jgi:hypothetical protein
MRFIKLFAIAKVDIIRVLICRHRILPGSVPEIPNECESDGIRLRFYCNTLMDHYQIVGMCQGTNTQLQHGTSTRTCDFI